MVAIHSQETEAKLLQAQNIWVASVRADGRPHLAPVWFAYHAGKLYFCIEAKSIKGINLAGNPRLALALEDGTSPVICEGSAAPLPRPWPEEVTAIFTQKYEWDISPGGQYDQLIEVTPRKWLAW